MAYLLQPDDTVAGNTVADVGANAPADGSTAAPNAGAAAQAAAPSAPAQNQPEKTSTSGNFVDLSKYLDANQGQSMQMGQNVAGLVTSAADKATNDINTAKTAVGGQITAGTDVFNPDFYNQVIANPVNLNAADTAAVAKQISGSYTGPTSSTSTGAFTPADQSIVQATQEANLVNSTGGQKELINQLPTATPYAQGTTSLDSYLLSNTEGALAPVKAASTAAAPLAANETQAEADLTAQIQAAKDASTAAGQQGIDTLTGAATGVQNQILSEVSVAQATASAKQAAIQAALTQVQTGYVTPLPDLLATMGVTQDVWDQLVAEQAQAVGLGSNGVNLNAYLTNQNVANVYTPNTVATQDEAARYQALMTLAGQQGNFINPNQLSAPGSISSLNTQQAMADLNAQIQASQASQAAALRAQGYSVAQANQIIANGAAQQKAAQAAATQSLLSNVNNLGSAANYAYKIYNALKPQAPAPVETGVPTMNPGEIAPNTPVTPSTFDAPINPADVPDYVPVDSPAVDAINQGLLDPSNTALVDGLNSGTVEAVNGTLIDTTTGSAIDVAASSTAGEVVPMYTQYASLADAPGLSALDGVIYDSATGAVVDATTAEAIASGAAYVDLGTGAIIDVASGLAVDEAATLAAGALVDVGAGLAVDAGIGLATDALITGAAVDAGIGLGEVAAVAAYSIVCYELVKTGQMPMELAVISSDFSKNMNPAIIKGYHHMCPWFLKMMRTKPWAHAIIKYLSVKRCLELDKGDFAGKIVRIVFEPLAYIIGKTWGRNAPLKVNMNKSIAEGRLVLPEEKE